MDRQIGLEAAEASGAKAVPYPLGRTKIRPHWPLILLGLISFFNSIDARVIGAIAESIKHDLRLTDTQLGLLTGFAFSVCYALFSIPVAHLSDRNNRARIISVAIALWSFMTMICGLSGTYGRLLFGRMGVAIGESAFAPAAYSLIADYFDDSRRARAMATLSVASALGTLMAFTLGGMMASAFGWRAVFLVLGLPGLVLAAISWFKLPDPRTRLSASGLPQAKSGGLADFREILRAPGYVLMTAGGAVLTFSMAAILVWSASFFLRSYNWSMGDTGLILGLTFGLAGVASPLFTTYLGDRLAASREGGKRLTAHIDVVAGLTAIAIPAITIALFVPVAPVSLAMIGLTYFLTAGWAANIMATMRSQVPGTRMAVAAAVMGLSFNLVGFGLGPLVVGYVSDALHPALGSNDIRFALFGCTVALSIGLVLLLFASRRVYSAQG